MITFFIPIYNEEVRKNLRPFLSDLSKFISNRINTNNHFIFVNDGSTDNTKNVLKKFYKKLDKKIKKNIFFIINNRNMGVGYSFKKTLAICKTKYIMPLPSDNDIPMLDVQKYLKNNIDLVMFYPTNIEKYSRNRYVLTMLFRMMWCYFFDAPVNYIQAPCIYKCNIIKKIKVKSNRMSYWPELNVKLLKSNIKYSEIPTRFKHKSYIDRTVSVKNFIEVVYRFISVFIDIKIINSNTYKFKAKKIYF